MAILLNTAHGKILIANIYKHPTFQLSESHIKKLSDEAKIHDSSILIGGDFNSHHTSWGCGRNCRSGNNIFDAAFENDLHILNDGSPTYINNPNQHPSAIDLTLVSVYLAISCSWSVLTDAMNSDHYPIEIKIGTSGDEYKFFKHKFKIKGVNWEEFYKHLDSELENITKLYPDATKAYEKLVSTIINGLSHNQTSQDKTNKQASNAHTKTNIKRPHKSPAPWWTPDCAKAVHKRKLTYSNFRINGSYENYLAMKRQEAETRRILRKAKKDGWKAFCGTINRNTPPNAIWNKIKAFKNKAMSTLQHITQQDQLDGVLKKEFINTFCHNSSKILLSQEVINNITRLQSDQDNNENPFTPNRDTKISTPITLYT
ncbi:uncharacterized protein LOC103579772 [Microplitis demolitor]|uniref:uncharacterized protein LOC103579772 n=1 Tax=Microplitis demolitor TaxID=69319 RepID=UPI0006D4D663|nr:uncharacterized protein LOC103579772 [Microplitis demolitor]